MKLSLLLNFNTNISTPATQNCSLKLQMHAIPFKHRLVRVLMCMNFYPLNVSINLPVHLKKMVLKGSLVKKMVLCRALNTQRTFYMGKKVFASCKRSSKEPFFENGSTSHLQCQACNNRRMLLRAK